jgi:hypothetical protein
MERRHVKDDVVEVACFHVGHHVEEFFQAGGKQMAVVLEIVYSHLETSGSKLISQLAGNLILSLRNEIKGRLESELVFQLRKRPAVCQSCAGFYVVRQDKGKLLALRPT